MYSLLQFKGVTLYKSIDLMCLQNIWDPNDGNAKTTILHCTLFCTTQCQQRKNFKCLTVKIDPNTTKMPFAILLH